MPIAPLLLLAALAAQPASSASQPAAPPPVPSGRGGRLFISPMGEPFRPHGRPDDALADWFRQADTDHDGYLTLDEMIKDAERFFAVLDVNHDGEIDPDEITRYEEVIAPEIRSGPNYALELAGGDEGERGGRGGYGGRRGGGGHTYKARGGAEDMHQGAGRYGLLDLPEPVVSADADFNRGVSLNEFRQAAIQRFVALDLDHQGRLSLAELESIHPAPPPQPNNQTSPDAAPPPPQN